MINIPPDQVPVLPVQEIIAGEMVAYGVVDEGVLVHFLERDLVRLIEWSDIIPLGIREKLEISKTSDGDLKEIAGPVVPP